jgi:hypothetical protein
MRYTAAVTDDHVDRIDEVADALRARGFNVEGVLAELGLITLDADPSGVEQAAAVEGVDSVTPSGDYQLPPPEAPIQ